MKPARAAWLVALVACGPAEATHALRPGEKWSTPYDTSVEVRVAGHAVTTAPAIPAGGSDAAMGHEYFYELVFECDGVDEIARLGSTRTGTTCGHAWQVVKNELPRRLVLRVQR